MPSSILNFMVPTATMCNNNNNFEMLAKYLWNVFEVLVLYIYFKSAANSSSHLFIFTCFSKNKRRGDNYEIGII